MIQYIETMEETMISSLWWYDSGLHQHFSIGKLSFHGVSDEDVICEIPNEEQSYVALKQKSYVVLSARLTEGMAMSDVMKELIHFAHGIWLPEITFERYVNHKVYIYIGLAEKG